MVPAGEYVPGATTVRSFTLANLRTRVAADAGFVPVLVVFSTSTCLMTLEIAAGRLVSRHLGASLYTWTSVIGVVLGGLSLGQFIGGRIADRSAFPRAKLAPLLHLSALGVLSVLLQDHLMGGTIRPSAISWPLWVLLNVLVIFTVPAVLLGLFSPIASRIVIREEERVGRAVASIYVAGTVGSILGTFLAGFVLVDLIGTRAVVGAVAVTLALTGLLARTRPIGVVAVAAVSVASVMAASPSHEFARYGIALGLRASAQPGTVYADDSAYQHVLVREAGEQLILQLDNLIHSYASVDDPMELGYGYEDLYAAVTDALADPDEPLRTLSIGGGGFVFPRYLRRRYPHATIDVVEIDPAVTRAAREYMGLTEAEYDGMRVITADARAFVREERLRASNEMDYAGYDFIYGDAFNDFGVPAHLLTSEFNESLRSLLQPRGAYLLNLIDLDVGEGGKILGAVARTLAAAFDFVYVLEPADTAEGVGRTTFVLIASLMELSESTLGELVAVKGHLLGSAAPSGPDERMKTILGQESFVLTDDFAPVEKLLIPVLLSR